MCYSTTLRKQRKEVEKRLYQEINTEFEIDFEYTPYFHLNGFSHGNVYIIKMDEPDRIHPAAWGLVPDWGVHNPEVFWKKSNTLNARAESLFEKPSFKNSANDKRCLILSDGFYEPHHVGGVSIPHFCYQPSKEYPEGDLFLFAGLYNELDNDLLSATIITVEANDFFAEVHNKKKRMPLVLAYDLYEDWLDNGLNQSQLNELMAYGFTNRDFKAHPINRDLYYKKNVNTNIPEIIKPIDYPELNTLF
ncbi:SOS response-associated peptidase [Seonamhaeicola maritimus]|uniref:Abasic site processing protein n=1 Tax=Seonamhaeicola maritimus TaxID=2591822 RepID=A0A5C7GHG3_9FLAO|nr:SOS response-associated peptidase [Seonamhaeicola maritimus]TXG37027.1 SOS response-associated peptidase [Seonamhaeicola maritimus]